MASYKLLQFTAILMGLMALVASSSVSTDESECPTICAAIYRPVCATNGRTFKEFSNSCELKASNCRLRRLFIDAFMESDYAWCSSELVENIQEKLGPLNMMSASCMRPCPMIYQPLCATNGKYRALISSPCVLDSINCALSARGTDTSELLRVLRADTC